MSESIHHQAAALLGRYDNRYTHGRRRLVSVLASAARPVTLPEILLSDPDLPQSSVYRNLEVLERSGVIRRIATGGDHAYFELAEPLLGHHHHLICVDCGAIEDIRLTDSVERTVDEALTDAARETGFRPLHHSVDLHGHCAACA